MKPIVLVLYFFVGLFVGTAAFMLITAGLKPLILGLGSIGPLIGFLTPFIVGLFGGCRTAYVGYRANLRLPLALRKAFLFF